MTSTKGKKKVDDKPQKDNPNTIGEAGQTAGNTRDKGFGGARGGGTGDSSGGVGTLPTGSEGAEGGSATGSIGSEQPDR